MQEHPFPPVCDKNSKILILGSFPSVRSRETMFFYGHPQNRFWKVLSVLFDSTIPDTIDQKKAFLLFHGIALWDVIACCEIKGSSDSSINNVTVNDISIITNMADIRQIYVNGKTAEKYYKKYLQHTVCRQAVYLPSTSPANAAFSFDMLVEKWSVIKESLEM